MMTYAEFTALELIARDARKREEQLASGKALTGRKATRTDLAYLKGLLTGMYVSVAYIEMERQWKETQKPVPLLYDFSGKSICEKISADIVG